MKRKTTKSKNKPNVEKIISKTIGKNMGAKKYIFTLIGINTEKVDQRFGISIVSNIIGSDRQVPENTTKISDLTINRNTPEIISFIDEAKKVHKCNVSMIDFNTNKRLVCSSIYNCFWHKNTIPDNVIAIGCPIKYVYSQAVKTYYSEISKDKYTIKENITTERTEFIQKDSDSKLSINDRNYYLTDGVFCSFNCCKAYIDDNKHNSLYDMSNSLLLKMYHDIYPTKVASIDSAPHWRKLKEYGGDMIIEQFLDSFNKIEYQDHGFISNIPTFKSIGVLFEEKLKF
jgi:hypothetical protein